MGGEYLVELVWRAAVYTSRSIRRWRKLQNAANWLPVKGLVRNVTRDAGVVEVLITYQFRGGYFCDYHKRDLFWTESAERYAARFPAESGCVIRVNPARPDETAVVDDDQLRHIQAAAVPQPPIPQR